MSIKTGDNDDIVLDEDDDDDDDFELKTVMISEDRHVLAAPNWNVKNSPFHLRCDRSHQDDDDDDLDSNTFRGILSIHTSQCLFNSRR